MRFHQRKDNVTSDRPTDSAEGTTTDLSSPPPARRRRRLLIGGVAAVLLLPVIFIAVAALLLPTEVVARAAASRAEAALGVPVAIADLKLDLLPVPSVAIVGGRLGPESAPVATIDRVLLRPRLLPLLSGRVIVSEITIDRPWVHLAVDSAGALNLPFGGEDAEAADPSTARIDFQVDDLRIRDGMLRWTDARDRTDIVVTGLDQRLRIVGRVAEGGLASIGLQGRIASDSIDATLAGLAAPLRGVRLVVEHDAELDRETDRLDLTDLRVELQRLALQGRGHIEGVADSLNRAVSLELVAEEFDFEDLARSLPPGFLDGMLRPAAGGDGSGGMAVSTDAGPEMQFAGAAAIQATVAGPLGRDSMPAVRGELRLRDAGVVRGGANILSATEGTVSFSNESVGSREVRGNLFGAPFTLAFEVDDLASPVVDFEARGTAVLAELLALVPSEADEPIRATGNLPFDLRGRLVSSDPVLSSIEGTVGLGGTRAELPTLLQPLEVTGGRLRFAGEVLHLEELGMAFGESRLVAGATVEEWLPAALGDSMAIARVRFDASAGTLDLDALLGPSESEYTPLLFARLTDGVIDGRPVEDVARELGLSLPELPRVRASGDLRADRLVRNGMTFEGIEARLDSSPEAVSAPRVRFGFMGGVVELGLALERGVQDATVIAVYHLENVGAGAFLSRFTPFEGHLSGLMTLDGEVSLQLDDLMLPVRPSLRSAGRAAFTSGALTNWPLVEQVGNRLGLQSFDTIAFREWSGEFVLAGPMVSLQRSVQLSDGLRTEMAGSFDISGELDLGLVAHLSPTLAAAAGEQVRAAATSLAGADGTVPVGLRIGGTTRAPTIALDLTAARDEAIARARERATEEAESAARRAAAELGRRTLGDSIPTDPAAIGEAVRERVGDRIRGLFGRQTAQPAQPQADPPAAGAGAGAEEPQEGAAADSVATGEGG